MDASRISQATALQLDDCRCLVAEELLGAEALAIDPDQIQAGLQVADQRSGLSGCDANGSGQNQIGPVAAIPEPHIPKPTAMAAGQA